MDNINQQVERELVSSNDLINLISDFNLNPKEQRLVNFIIYQLMYIEEYSKFVSELPLNQTSLQTLINDFNLDESTAKSFLHAIIRFHKDNTEILSPSLQKLNSIQFITALGKPVVYS